MSDDRGALLGALTEGLLRCELLLAHPKTVTPQLAEAWLETLADEDLTPQAIAATISQIAKTQRFFPTPADFLAALNGPAAGGREPLSLDDPEEVWEAYALKLCGWDRAYWQELEFHLRMTLVRDAKRTWQQLRDRQPAGGPN